jgi:hypothetical protein
MIFNEIETAFKPFRLLNIETSLLIEIRQSVCTSLPPAVYNIKFQLFLVLRFTLNSVTSERIKDKPQVFGFKRRSGWPLQAIELLNNNILLAVVAAEIKLNSRNYNRTVLSESFITVLVLPSSLLHNCLLPVYYRTRLLNHNKENSKRQYERQDNFNGNMKDWYRFTIISCNMFHKHDCSAVKLPPRPCTYNKVLLWNIIW